MMPVRMLLVLICTLGALPDTVGQTAIINEVMVGNEIITATDGQTYPWIEFRNNSNSRIDLSNYYLSSDSANLKQWKLSSRFIESDSVALVWLSGTGAADHSTFQIDVHADYLLLTNGHEINDCIPLKNMVKNESYGRRGEFDDQWVYFIQPDHITPGKENVDPGPWIKVQGNADFQKGDAGYYGCLVYDDKMWILNYETLTEDGTSWVILLEVWNSEDGFSWKQVNKNPPYHHGAMFAVFQGYMWAFDGRAFRSKDGINWEQVSSNAPASERVAVLNDNLWSLQNNSILKSTDGITWAKAVEEVPWYPRTWPAFMEHNGKLWMFGGNINYQTGYDMYFTDVWSSEDGINWELVNYRAPWRGTFWFTYASYDGKIWMIDGGWNYWDRLNPYNGNGNEVWYSSDGVEWKKSAAPTNWFNRHAQFMWVFKDELWIAAGFAGGGPHHLYNDVWRYSRKPNPIAETTQLPVITTYGSKIALPGADLNSLGYSLSDPSLAAITSDSLIAMKAGEATITVFHGGDDFHASATWDIPLNIMKKRLSAQAIDTTLRFGDPCRDFRVGYSGFEFDDGVQVLNEPPIISVIAAEEHLPLGTYSLMPHSGSDDNYSFTYKGGKLTVTESSGEDVLVYPNPARETVKIIPSREIQGEVLFEVFTSSGLLAYRIAGKDRSLEFDISCLDPGVYIARLSWHQGIVVRKIVKL